MTDESSRGHACLAVTGSFDPDELTRLLGEPTRTARAGQIPRPGAAPYRSDTWHLETEPSGSGWSTKVEEILGRVRPNAAAFRAVCETHGLQPSIHLVAYVAGATWPDGLSAETVREIADLGCGIDVDLYCIGE